MSKNDTIFIIGSGPSLNQIDMQWLKDKNTFSMNRQYIAYEDWGFYPTYYAVIDRYLVANQFMAHIVPKLINNEEVTISKYFVALSNWRHNDIEDWMKNPANEENVSRVLTFSNNQLQLEKEKLEFLNDKNPDMWRAEQVMHVKSYANCGIFATNLAALMGYKRIVLLGMDLKYTDWKESVDAGKDLSHFHPKYFDVESFEELATHGAAHPVDNETEKPWSDMFNSLKKVFLNVGEKPPEIVSATPNSPLNSVVEYIPFHEIVYPMR